MKIKAIIKSPSLCDLYGHVGWIENTLDSFQKQVQGYIECVRIPDLNAVIICNEEGVINGMPFNCWIGGHCFFGPIVVVGVQGDEFASVPISFQKWKDLLKYEGGYEDAENEA